MSIELHGVTKRYGATVILNDVTLKFSAREKLGIVGVNGSGKTTLARIIAGIDPEFDGVCITEPGITVAYVPQHLDADPTTTCLAYIMDEVSRLYDSVVACEAELSRLDSSDAAAVDAALRRYQAARDAYDAAGGDSAEAAAVAALDAVGLPGRAASPVGELSGGEQNILSLAKAVARDPDVLILDEPGNHLDFDGLDWLERYLSAFPGVLVIVSHNRYLLDRVTNATIELERRSARRYEGNYSAYRLAKLRTATAQQADYAADTKKLARLEALVAKFAEIARTHASKAWGRRLRARRTQLEHAREAATEKPELPSSSIAVQFGGASSKAEIAIEITGYSKAFGELVLFENASTRIACGERVAIVGANGSGKTTLLRDIVENGSWENPCLRVGPSMRIGYCAQHQDIFRADATILDEMVRFGVRNAAEAIRVLGRYLFSYDDLSSRVGTLSGGERNRLQFAVCELNNANLLLLDEPTNHMDIESREAIEDALDEFPGTIVLISHDRYLIDAVAERVIEISDRSFESYDGDFTAYRAARPSRAGARLHTRGRERSGATRERHAGKEAGARSHGSSREFERRIATLESEKLSLEQKITAAFRRGDHVGGKRLANDLERTSRELDRSWTEWMAAEQ